MTGNTVLLDLEKHPCYSHSAHFRYGRIHLPVALECNLGCNYCERQIGGMTYHSYRPAVADAILTPEEALSRVAQYIQDIDLTVAGIAGPGEPLHNPETLETLRLIHHNYPELMLCISTNGFLLPKYAERLRDLGVRTVTVTLNTVDPEIGARIYAYVKHNGQMARGIRAAKMLLDNQLDGIKRAVSLGLIVKVNSILIPGINDNMHLEKVARTAKSLGAYIQNITPLIPLGRFKHLEATSCYELRWTRFRCERIISQFRLCQQCRADAVGIPGDEKARKRESGKMRERGSVGASIKQIEENRKARKPAFRPSGLLAFSWFFAPLR